MITDLANKALQIAVTQIGKEEVPRGSNWGRPVQDYLLRVGINFPASWCMAFMYWCFDEAVKTFPDRANPLVRTAGVLNAWNKALKYRSAEPKAGDIFIMDFGGGLGHTGIVEVIIDGQLHTIEGNTNDTGSREGYEVCRRIRDPRKIKGYLRY